jgi:hypothetical protein
MIRLGYILSASHSGSTLLAMLLGSQPGICTVGELKATSLGDPGRYRCSCGASIKNCEFWSEVSNAMQQKGIKFDVTCAGTNIHDVDSAYLRRLLAPLHRGPLWELARDVALNLSPTWHAHVSRVQNRNRALIETLAKVRAASVIVDSSKIGLRLKYQLRDPQLDVRVIRLIRDGRAVALSYMDPFTFADAADPKRRAGGSGGDRDCERKRMVEAAREWRRSNEEAETLLPTVGQSRWVEVRYEELCANPAETVRRICLFLGIDSVRVVLDFRSVEQHVVGNGMRLDSTSEIRVDERWREHLTEDDLRAFDRVAGSLNRRYGYN